MGGLRPRRDRRSNGVTKNRDATGFENLSKLAPIPRRVRKEHCLEVREFSRLWPTNILAALSDDHLRSGPCLLTPLHSAQAAYSASGGPHIAGKPATVDATKSLMSDLRYRTCRMGRLPRVVEIADVLQRHAGLSFRSPHTAQDAARWRRVRW